MSTKNTKKKSSIFNSKNFIVLGIAAGVVILFSVIATMLVPPGRTKDESDAFKNKAWETAASKAEDRGLTSVYNEEAVPAAATVEESKTENTDSNKDTKSETPPATDGTTGQATFKSPVSGAVINDYSGDELVYSETMKDWRTHNGIDFSADEGTDVLAAADGTIEAISENGMFGRSVIILHQGGVRTIYSNLAEGNEVAIGDSVKQGTPIGKVGNSASAEALEKPHLHFEVSLNEEIVNPHDYLPETPSTEE